MLHQPTIEKLISMRLQGMVDGLEAIERDEAARDLTFEDKLALIVDRQYTWRQNLAFQQRLKRARLRGSDRFCRAPTPPCKSAYGLRIHLRRGHWREVAAEMGAGQG